ncbi:MAG: PilT/PilU family type 4a pilus ATPase [Chthonomonadaceae bacterium]|nr:PilT/PilU family type 4a pilus ATPase [Chthonomonadaceae bacterium]
MNTMTLDEMILWAYERKASDLFLRSEAIPAIRQHGRIVVSDFPLLSIEEVKLLCYSKMNARQQAIFEQHHEMDLAFSIGDQLRIRMNVYMQRGHCATVCRLIPTQIRSLDDLGVPAKVKEFTTHKNGLVLVTGPTGSGKTTTLAAMIDLLNKTRAVNIITLEDPIEFVHKDQMAIVSQREVGIDTENFNVALKHVLRQAPDIILIGEMRDLETMNTALQAAETGHLVFATVHTASAAETLDRISNMYAPHERPMLWLRLSTTLRGVLSQKLLPRSDGGGRIAAIEVMDVTPTIVGYLEDGRSDDIYSAIRQAGGEAYWGMQTMNQCLLRYYKAGLISEEIALSNAGKFTELKQMIRMAVTKGEVQTSQSPSQQQAPR